MAAARKRAPAKRSAASRGRARPPLRRSPADRLRALAAPRLEAHQLDILALALIAAGIFLCGVAYLRWAGGPLGSGLVTFFRVLVGELGYAIPAVMVLAGAMLLMRELRPPARPLRAGTLCLLCALTLALTAHTLGLGPGRPAAGTLWSAHTLEARGGTLGGIEFWTVTSLISTTGAHILALFLMLAGGILVTGATVAGVIRATGEGFADATETLRRGGTVATAAASRTRRPAAPAPEVLTPDWPLEPEPIAEPFPWGESEDDVEEDDAPTDEVVLAVEPDDVPAEEPRDAAPPANGSGTVQPDPEENAPEIRVSRGDLTPQGRYRASVTDDPDFHWEVPPGLLLTRSSGEASKPDTAGQEKTAAALVEALDHFGIESKVVGLVSGPHITRYELRLAPGTKMAKISNLKDDLAYALAATDVRILAPIPGKTAVGVEVPNARRRVVHLGDVLGQAPEDWSPLTVWLGKDISGKSIGADLARMPHLLVAGTTGAGKSACVNSMLSSILLRATPHEVRLVLIDPKQVELNHYESIPHLLTPVITSPRQAANALQNLVREMELRYGMMSLARTRNLPELNKVRASRGEPPLPYILTVIDELADLMMVAPADVEDSIVRLAQKARAVGMHLVLATQSPRVTVITGLIKANVPSRIAFAVSSLTDSRVILDQGGAESLIGMGDMLFAPIGTNRLQRIQGAYIDEAQIEQITSFWRRQGEPEFQEELLVEVAAEEETGSASEEGEFPPDEDPLLEEAISLVAGMGTASTSMLQRRLRLGYTRAGRLIDMLERRGIISGYEGSKPRQVLITEADVPRVLVALAEANKAGAGAGKPAAEALPGLSERAAVPVAERAAVPVPDLPDLAGLDDEPEPV